MCHTYRTEVSDISCRRVPDRWSGIWRVTWRWSRSAGKENDLKYLPSDLRLVETYHLNVLTHLTLPADWTVLTDWAPVQHVSLLVDIDKTDSDQRPVSPPRTPPPTTTHDLDIQIICRLTTTLKCVTLSQQLQISIQY